ncbi:2'-deoxycytidine 5'-triphosphate deaminase [Oceanicella actignis]|uniref:dCTP deaminase n=1 Tax=Oceanicella actignis TaxID=1189325 RepID=A0A1M7SAF1_9RHOB|nr:2'-deoxycytidine 5'-triphosphate deaminase [Oceanicella actignis]SET29982.1 dCTP deaminase [Oceanicella actignis]SHN55354.1 dCTP deaminase [Oceanicella actignis]
MTDAIAPGPGVLPAQSIRAMIARGMIRADGPIEPVQIQPASLDLRLSARAYRVRASFLARGRSVARRLDEFAMHEIDLAPGAVLEKGCVYVVPLRESLALPADVHAVANAKSSTGRLDLLTRLIADRGQEFDRVEAGYEGPLYAEISPRSFSVLVRPGMRLNQIRFRRGRASLADDELRALHARVGLVDVEPVIDQGLGFSVDLSMPGGGPAGWRARPHAGLVDLDRIGHYDPLDFWEPVLPARSGSVILDPGAFYILVSRESVHVPPDCAAEMAPYLAMAGEFRVHYAGFFDPGFGHAAAGGAGSRGVLEVRCYEAPFALEHGQVVGRLVYERMAERPEVLYGAGLGSNYQGQGLKLAKQFRDPAGG